MYSSTFEEGVIHRGIAKGHVEIFLHNIRDYASGKHKKVDDSPFGGGPGMIMKPEPIFNAVETISKNHNISQVGLGIHFYSSNKANSNKLYPI